MFWRRLGRNLLTAGPALAAAVCVAVGADHHAAAVRDLWLATALPLLVTAVGWRAWTAPEEGQADALRLRRLSRRIALRVTTVLATAASVGLPLWLATRGVLAHDVGVAAVWSALLAPVPVLVETVLWLFAPSGLRWAVRSGRLLEETQALAARVHQVRPLVFDPARGRYGRPVPRRFTPARGEFGEPCTARPNRGRIRLVRGRHDLGWVDEQWIGSAAVSWTGTALALSYAPGRTLELPLGPDAPPPTPSAPLPAVPVELIWLREHRDQRTEVRILLLDAVGRRLLTMSALGMRDTEVARVAQAAGLSYSCYELRLPADEPAWRSLPARLFPRRFRHVQLP
ncbi:hypothetical protein [Streptacidiphilus fuscans]|uniref:Transmembrane protein n=1 Tax=Streptacidiphilus fuscans TaxID=2789292 RepID=A0A931FCT3_9ACTN|nr:hypothetical protein [Streptacidiphilus fuscans]MBF9068808.1 hypothetical protein [Streptacidiphilus fuscans]